MKSVFYYWNPRRRRCAAAARYTSRRTGSCTRGTSTRSCIDPPLFSWASSESQKHKRRGRSNTHHSRGRHRPAISTAAPYHAFEPNWCYAENKCAEACGELLEAGTSHLELLKDLGDARCAMTGPSSRDAASYARKSASLLLGLSKEEEMQHKSRLPVYHALCPTQLQAVKVT